jgi:hypothetical protein
MKLKGRSFNGIPTIKQNATTKLDNLKAEGLQRCFQKWQKRWNICYCGETTLKGTASKNVSGNLFTFL